jgi:hypothetical protein
MPRLREPGIALPLSGELEPSPGISDLLREIDRARS